jgi:hypothetical protein
MTGTSSGRADLRDDLLRGIDAESGDLGEALHRVVVGREQVGHLLIELAEVILDHAHSSSVSFSSRR